jgi:hypothetical protein
MVATGSNLLISAEGPGVVELTTAGEIANTNGGGPTTDLVAHGHQAFVGYKNGRVGKISRERRERRERLGRQAEQPWRRRRRGS